MRTGLIISCFALLALAGGCGAPQRVYSVSSFPPGATVYVDGQPRGQTDMEKLSISFEGKPRRVLRVEKEGYQSTGTVLNPDSPEEDLFFPLQETPDNKKLLDALHALQRNQETLMSIINEMVKNSGKNP